MTNTTQHKKSFPNSAVFAAFACGATAGIMAGLRFAPLRDGKATRAGRVVDGAFGSTKDKAANLRDSVSCLVSKGQETIRKATSAVCDARERASEMVDARQKDAHRILDKTVSAVNSTAKSGHHAIDSTASAIHSGIRA